MSDNQSSPQVSSQTKTSLTTPVLVLISVIAVCFSLILASWILSNRTTVIRNLGTETTQDGALVNTISVQGTGVVSATPDTVEISVSFDETRDTSSAALQAVNEQVNQLRLILSDQGVAEEDIVTTNFSLSPEYDFSLDERRLIGQEARQSLRFTVKGVDAEGNKAAEVIDAVAGLSDIQFGGISFDIENKEPLYSQAREQAISQAKSRGRELADLAEVELGSVVNVSDTQVLDTTPVSFERNSIAALEDSFDAAGGTSVATGQLEVALNLTVVYEINPR
jgi:uncharacterized protein YggE